MPVQKRESASKESDIGAGPYLAKVIGHLDPSFMGGLQVTLLDEDGNTVGEETQSYTVRYASPFAGSTAFEFQGYNLTDHGDSQKSYGMWFVPPDVGVTVLVFFVDGNASKGYWLGCIPSRFANNMVPGIAASENVAFGKGDSDKYDVTSLPVTEVNRRANTLTESMQVDKIPKAIHPFADRLLEEGLLEDDVRGTTSSSGRRNAPSGVYGISTPGPVDRQDGAKKQYLGTSDSPTQAPVPVSRLGGSQFVMDDGDDRYQRATPATDGPNEYVPAGEGEATIPKDEFIRLRTRTGHQVLLHTSEDLIYIGNSRGTSWIEMSSDGKIDIYAEDSVSIHTKQDFNFYADRDINMEAGRNFNLKVAERHQTEVGGDMNLIVDGNNAIKVSGNRDTTISGSEKLTTAGDYDIHTSGNNTFTSDGDTDVNAGGDAKVTAGGNGSWGAAALVFTGGTIDLNGPAAPDAASAADATEPEALATFDNPVIDSGAAEWKGDRYDTNSPVSSIMKRIPMHEPWPNHENLDPASVKPDQTDREA